MSRDKKSERGIGVDNNHVEWLISRYEGHPVFSVIKLETSSTKKGNTGKWMVVQLSAANKMKSLTHI